MFLWRTILAWQNIICGGIKGTAIYDNRVSELSASRTIVVSSSKIGGCFRTCQYRWIYQLLAVQFSVLSNKQL